MCNFSSKSDEILVLGPICPNISFEQKILRCLYQIYFQHVQNTLSESFQVDQFAQIYILMVFNMNNLNF